MIAQLPILVGVYLAAHGVVADVKFGTLENARQGLGAGASARVVFAVAADDLGELMPTHEPGYRAIGDGQVARSLGNWVVPYRVHVWARDSAAARDEGLQLEAVERLFQWVVRAVAYEAGGGERWGKVRRVGVAARESIAGAGLEVSLTFNFPMLDVPLGVCVPGLGSSFTKRPTKP